MNKVIRNTLIVIAILILAVSAFFAGNVVARVTSYGSAGMMGNYEGNSTTNKPYGPGMMGGSAADNPNAAPLTLDEAKAAAESYLAALNNSDLGISEIMVFDNNAYVVVTEKSTGLGAFELLVDPSSHAAYPEYGPNMMWNLKYGDLNRRNMMGGRNGGGMMGGRNERGMMGRQNGGGMMGGRNGGGMMGGNGLSGTLPADVSADMTVTPGKAVEIAQAYLDANLPGAAAATDPIQFYGYYTLDFEQDGVVVGMLSVNGFTGQVFLHTWHGAFIQEQAY